jgi:hypothetical protein
LLPLSTIVPPIVLSGSPTLPDTASPSDKFILAFAAVQYSNATAGVCHFLEKNRGPVGVLTETQSRTTVSPSAATRVAVCTENLSGC